VQNENLKQKIFSKKRDVFSQSEQIKFNFFIYLRNHTSQTRNKMLLFAIHPVERVLVTVGQDESIMYYDIDGQMLLLMKQLEGAPSALKFSPDGNLLLIGFLDGSMLV